jgi:aldose sugar dehydrogenase
LQSYIICSFFFYKQNVKGVLMLTIIGIAIITIFLSMTAIPLFGGILSLPSSSPVVNVWALNVTGTQGDDTLTGTPQQDTIRGYGGDDIISGLARGDKIRGDGGDDTIHGNDGRDRIRGDRGNDMIFGDDGNDVLIAGPGNDTLTGGPGKDTFNCGEGVDTVKDFDPAENDSMTAPCENTNSFSPPSIAGGNVSINASPEQQPITQKSKEEVPIINNPNLKAEVVVNGLKAPTGMAFLGPNDILAIEKNKGTVQRIIDGKMLAEPLLDVNVANESERGLLGIAVSKNLTSGTDQPIYVFLFYTETLGKDGGNIVGNRLYRYELANNDKLVNPKLLLDLPTTPGPSHNGGVVKIGPDNNVYVVVGDLNFARIPSAYTRVQNNASGLAPDGRGGILRVTQNGEVVGGVGILGNEDPLNKYYAYGIRNSFGIGFDPVTGNLWETENGPNHHDEINLFQAGSNGGWRQVRGLASNDTGFDPNKDLVDFGGKGKYSDPKLDWYDTVAPTAITFLNSDKLGTQYENDIFIGSVKEGRIFNFKLNDNRTELVLGNLLDDKVADTDEELQGVTFGNDFGIITDLEVGPDGYLYVVSYSHGEIYRIVPIDNITTNDGV